MTYAEIIILASIMEKEQGSHGYEIKKNAATIFGQSITISNDKLYNSLHRFLKIGAVKSEVQPVPGKPDRHIYFITDKGRELFHSMIVNFTPEVAKDDNEFFTRVAFFNMLDPAEGKKILETRKAVIRDLVARLDKYLEICRSKNYVNPAEMMQFIGEQKKSELAWIESRESVLLK
ncbi:MAG TPA: PadR family transcriptional regulator [Methanocellaceae archaeon]|jgi:DNA-binding PadR family transcriptional regulator